MNNRNLIIGTVLILVIVVAGLLFYTQNRKIEETQTSTEESKVLELGEEQPGETAETIELTAVGEYTGTGTAIREYSGTKFVHMVVAQLDEPENGKFYEGWLVQKKPELTFISTGRLEKEGEKEYVLLFINETDYSSYNDVVITEETESLGLDNNPEAHVLEGTFE